MYVLACIPIYGDRGRDFCCDPAGSQESAPELGVGYEFAIKNAPLSGSLNTCLHFSTNRFLDEWFGDLVRRENFLGTLAFVGIWLRGLQANS